VAREAWEVELDRLRERYQSELPEKLAGLAALLEVAWRERGRSSLEAARREAHSLKGSSGSYGFDAACRELQRIEDGLGRLLDEPSPPELADAWPALEQALARAQESLQAA
jgi:chemotaxis protein histidine kinase CheA